MLRQVFFIKKCPTGGKQTRHRGQDDELLLEAHQLDLKDDPAPPGHLGCRTQIASWQKKTCRPGCLSCCWRETREPLAIEEKTDQNPLCGVTKIF